MHERHIGAYMECNTVLLQCTIVHPLPSRPKRPSMGRLRKHGELSSTIYSLLASLMPCLYGDLVCRAITVTTQAATINLCRGFLFVSVILKLNKGAAISRLAMVPIRP